MPINGVWLDESKNECIFCGGCMAICPEVFEVPGKMLVKEEVEFNLYEETIKLAAACCPTKVIKYD